MLPAGNNNLHPTAVNNLLDPLAHCSSLQINVRFQITSLSGSLLLPVTPLRMTPSVAVRVPPDDYDRVVQASEAPEAEVIAAVRRPQEVSAKGNVCSLVPGWLSRPFIFLQGSVKFVLSF